MSILTERSAPTSFWWAVVLGSSLLSFLAGCASRGQWGDEPGVHLVLPAGDSAIESVVWSPTQDGQVLVTSTDLNHSDSRVYLQDLTTGERRVLVQTDRGSLRGLALSPRGKQALVLQTTGVVGEPSELILVDVETLEIQFVTWRAGSAAWSRDGTALAYFSNAGTLDPAGKAISLRIRNTATKAERTLYASPYTSEMGLSWSPDNERIVFSLGEATDSHLYVVEVQSGRAAEITTSGSQSSPAWSPLDDIIAFQSYSRDGLESQIRLIRPNGDCEFTLPQLNYVWSPTWLPGATQLAVVALDGVYVAELKTLVGGEIDATMCGGHP